MRFRELGWKALLLAIAGLTILLLVFGWRFYAPALAAGLVAEDPLQRADAIIVLGSARIERTYEAGKLHQEQIAPVVYLSPNDDPQSIELMKDIGVRIPTFSENQRAALAQMGVPEDAILPLPGDPRSTADEARLVAKLAQQMNLQRVVVVTSRYHTRRTRIYFGKASGDAFQVIVRGSRYDRSNADTWWKRRGEQFDVLLEYLKLPKAITFPSRRLVAESSGPE